MTQDPGVHRDRADRADPADHGGGRRALLLRHGVTTWNLEHRWQGQADVPLDPLGRTQARHAAAHLVGHIASVVSSDLRRAAETARILADHIGVPHLADIAAIRERAAGAWEGLTRDEIEAAWPGYLGRGAHPPGYEDDASILRRALPAIGDLIEAFDTPAVVTHLGIIRTVVEALGGPPEPVGHLCGAWVHLDAHGTLAYGGWFRPDEIGEIDEIGEPRPGGWT